MSRARRVVMTGIWSVAIQLVSALTQLLVVPFFLKAWSDGVYNDWIALTALVSLLQYADGGMQGHVINLLTQKATQERWDELRRDLASATLMYSLASGLVLLGTGGLCIWLSASGHFHGRALESQAVQVAALLGVQVIFQLAQGLLGGLYRAIGRADLQQLIVLVLRSTLLIGTLLVLLLGRGVLVLAGTQLLLNGLAALWLFIDTRRRESHLALTFRGAELSRAWEFLGPSLLYLFVSISQGLVQSGTLLVIDALQPAALIVFSTTRVVTNLVRQVIGLFTNTVWPELTRLDAQGNREKFALAHRVLVKITASVALPLSAALFFSGVALYRVWTRGRAEADPMLLRLLLLEVTASVPWIASSYILVATSRIKAVSVLYLVAGLLHVALCFVAVKLWGVMGVGVVMLALAILLYGTLVPRWSLQVVGESWGSFVRGVYVPYALISALTLAAVWSMSRLALTNVWLQAIANGLGALIVAAPLCWRFLFTADERTFIISAARSVIARRRPTPAPEPTLST
jgi:O-antigen/teichoic acid export membrane protein